MSMGYEWPLQCFECDRCFAGHSLGGAVAEICALDLLHAAEGANLPDVKAIGFATPAIGNAALARMVQRRGWDRRLFNYLLPGTIPCVTPAVCSSTKCWTGCQVPLQRPAYRQTACLYLLEKDT